MLFRSLTDIEVDDKMLRSGSSEEVPEENYSGFDIDPTSTVSVGKVQKVDKRKFRIASMEPGEVLRLTYSVEIPTVGGSGQRIWTNTVTATDENGITDNDSCRVYAEPKPPKRLKIRKVGDRTTVKAGDIVTYTVTVKNNGLQNLVGVNITDDLAGIPAGNVVEFKLDTSSTVDQSPGNVTIKADKTGANIKEFQKDKIARFIYKIKIPDDALENQMFTNNVQAVDTDGTMASDSWRVVVKASQDRLEIKKSVDKNTAKRGEKVKYTVSVKNISGTKLKDVKVKDSLDGVTLTKTSGNITVTTNGNQANIGIFNPDETVTFEYEYTVPATAAGGSKIENIATATDPKGKEYTARQEVTVEGEPELKVKKNVDKPIVPAGDRKSVV